MFDEPTSDLDVKKGSRQLKLFDPCSRLIGFGSLSTFYSVYFIFNYEFELLSFDIKNINYVFVET